MDGAQWRTFLSSGRTAGTMHGGPAGGDAVPDPWGPDDGAPAGSGRKGAPGPAGLDPALMHEAAMAARRAPPRRSRIGWYLALGGLALVLLAMVFLWLAAPELESLYDPRNSALAEVEGNTTQTISVAAQHVYVAYWNASEGGDAPSAQLIDGDGQPLDHVDVGPNPDRPYPDARFEPVGTWKPDTTGELSLVNNGTLRVWIVDQTEETQGAISSPLVVASGLFCMAGLCLLPVGIIVQIVASRRARAPEKRVFLQLPDGQLVPVAAPSASPAADGPGPAPMTTDQLYALHRTYPALVEVLAGTPPASRPGGAPATAVSPLPVPKSALDPFDELAPVRRPADPWLPDDESVPALGEVAGAPPRGIRRSDAQAAPSSDGDDAWRAWDEG